MELYLHMHTTFANLSEHEVAASFSDINILAMSQERYYWIKSIIL